MELPEDHPTSFGHLVTWLYKSKITTPSPNPCRVHTIKGAIPPQEHWLEWCRLWVFADKIGVDDLAQQAFSTYKKCDTFCPYCHLSAEAVNYIFENAPDTCPIRARMVGNAVKAMFRPCFDIYEQENINSAMLNDDFRNDVLRGVNDHLFVDIAGGGKGCKFGNCKLHTWGNGEGYHRSLHERWSTDGHQAGLMGSKNPPGYPFTDSESESE